MGDPGILGFAPYLLMLGCGLACLTALLLRFRRSRGIERQQLKWLLFACVVTITIVLVAQPGTTSQWDLGMLLAVPFSQPFRWPPGSPSCAIGSMRSTG